MKWLLILIVFNSTGTPTTTQIEFNDQLSCVLAMSTLREDLTALDEKGWTVRCFGKGRIDDKR